MTASSGARDGARSRPARVAMVTARAQPEIGGIESHVAEVARRVAERGYDLEVLTTDRSRRLPAVERLDGYVVRRFRAFPASRDYYFAPGMAWALLRGRYDLLHVQGVHTLVPPLTMLVALLARLPYVLTFHTGGSSSAVRERARSTQWRVLAPLLRRAAALVGVSVFEATRFDDVLGEPGRVRVIRNGGSLPVHRAVQPDPDLIVTTGRLERYKGHHRIIEALPELARSRPEVRLEVLGAGPYQAELEALAQRLGVAERVQVRFIPPVERQQMAEALMSAGAVTLLSDYEAHPVAVMEALTLGRPVVVARTSGLSELVDLGWVRGVAPDAGPEEVAATVAAQLDAPVLPAREALPTWTTCVEQLVDVYEEALGRAVRGGRA